MTFVKFRELLAECRRLGYTDMYIQVCGKDLVVTLRGKNPQGDDVHLSNLYKPRKDKRVRAVRECGLFCHWLEADRVYRDKGK